MESMTRAMITLLVLMALIFGLYFFASWFSIYTGYVLGEDEKVKLAQCLSEKNSVFYVSSTCPDCDKQLGKFGETAKSFLTIHECKNAEDCPAVGGVPAWRIDEKFYYGDKSLDELIEISECKIS